MCAKVRRSPVCSQRRCAHRQRSGSGRENLWNAKGTKGHENRERKPTDLLSRLSRSFAGFAFQWFFAMAPDAPLHVQTVKTNSQYRKRSSSFRRNPDARTRRHRLAFRLGWGSKSETCLSARRACDSRLEHGTKQVGFQRPRGPGLHGRASRGRCERHSAVSLPVLISNSRHAKQPLTRSVNGCRVVMSCLGGEGKIRTVSPHWRLAVLSGCPRWRIRPGHPRSGCGIRPFG